MNVFEFELPTIRGIQAGRPYYLTACPLGLLSRLFPEGDEVSSQGKRHQTPLNRARIPEIAKYVLDNPKSYILGALTASVDRAVRFAPDAADATVCSGRLRIPMSARFVLHDGQHRCAGLQAAVNAEPSLAEETIAILLFVDPEFKRSPQFFADLRGHERRLPRSLSILHDERDEYARLTREVIQNVGVFQDHVEMTRTTISNRSRKLFTLSAIYQATKTLLAGLGDLPYETKVRIATEFWGEVARLISAWQEAVAGNASPAELRKEFIHSHAIALAALGRVGHALLLADRRHWKSSLRALRDLDWSRSNSRLWEGRAMIAGRLSKANSCVVLTANAIKQHLGLELTAEEQMLERQFKRRGQG